MILLLISLFVIPGVLGGQYCRQYYSYSNRYITYYCSGYCCGSLYADDCCGNNNNYDDDDDHSGASSVGYIIAAIIFGIIGFIVLISIIVCIVKACSKNAGSHGRVIHPGQSGVFVVQPGYNSTVYPGPGIPPPGPVHMTAPPPYAPSAGYGQPGPERKQDPSTAFGPAYPTGEASTSRAPGSPPPPYALTPDPLPQSTPVGPPAASGPPPPSAPVPESGPRP